MSTSKVLLLTLVCTLVCLPLASSAQAKETPVRIYDTAKQKLMHENRVLDGAGENGGGSVARSQDMAREREQRIAAIHERYVFADIHAHPSRFHRGNVERIGADEVALYQRGLIDLVVCNVSTDAAFQGGYVKPDGSDVPRLRGNDVYPIAPGEAFAFTLDRLARVQRTIDAGDAVHAASPEAVLAAKQRGRLSLMPALEGADGLESSVENLRDLYGRGVRLVQLMHFVDNTLGSNQTPPYDDDGLSDVGRDIVREANRLGMIVDLAHANTQTIVDAIEISSHPIVFSHTGVKARLDKDRHLEDEEIRAIAGGGGVIGIWPTADLETIEEMVRHIDHVKELVGIDHVAIASDLRGMSYIDAFGDEANFRVIIDGLLDFGYTNDEVGKVMGGNFFRVWQQVSAARPEPLERGSVNSVRWDR